MFDRRKFLQSSLFGSLGLFAGKRAMTAKPYPLVVKDNPIVISTWDTGLAANRGAWQVLGSNGKALDAVEAGVRVTEASINCCVGLGANPDRDGFVTLDACIMDDKGNCGSVGCLERIKHPISVARRVMEKTPHVMLVGIGAQQFAVAEGFPLEEQKLSDDAKRAYQEWLKKSEYKPIINVENTKGGHGPFAPARYEDGSWNHDTIGMVAMDAAGNLSGSCTTSGMGFKMRGRLGDSPIIGAGLFVDNEVGAATATGQGEDVIRICGTHTVVELMRQGLSPEAACKAAVERIVRIKGEGAKAIQVAFLALNKQGEVGAFAIQKGFSYAVRNNAGEKMVDSKSWYGYGSTRS
ncbi:MAG: N(4)-(beta-N-acetylglucosaminyl)-L-asparaginase [Bacteroidota bacterium]|nr:N(4)-(beta-N-acetylglucosaminyl)-L-asparaginase [Bacteroidota bacterium]MDP4217403.1 N(4)-(beta-N-acetylglucosaminyl)-L-asparaginase [Bacteroidota bacterium]MDP4245855.1 N(4)-(beta-N-acetylglucosaminyl)-L-asparaginase [Bacteroidota bacterium]MDP4257401.1 N(4)-(beta-N-acetylglucosaminyl)-L-asparaginase [Bacteroidota bacterium]